MLATLLLLACGTSPYRLDEDDDGYPQATDCDDADPAVHPGAAESCDGVDQDCDGRSDGADTDVVDGAELHPDADGDGYGDLASSRYTCASDGWVTDGSDCDDTRASAHPGAVETCDGADEDCDGAVDEDAVGTVYDDADGDGYGDVATGHAGCDGVLDATDCDDARGDVHPGAVETCDGADEDCDGAVDEGADGVVYEDADGDGFGDVATAHGGCDGTTDATDCDDSRADVHPGAEEVCDDGLDQDCDPGPGACDLEGVRGSLDTTARFDGTSADVGMGSALAGAADVDGDGRDDWLVGAPAGAVAGMVTLLPGGAEGNLATADALLTIAGTGVNDGLGGSVVFLGDVDGDGLPDLAAGAPRLRVVGGPGGAVLLVPGSARGVMEATDSPTLLFSPDAGTEVGTALAPLGDADGDGTGDLALLGASSAWVASVAAAGEVDVATLAWQLDGTFAAVAGPGDFDGDGLGDLAVGDPEDDRDTGAVYLFFGLGPGTWEVDDADARLVGEDVYDRAGSALAAAGDRDLDGYGDLLVGADSADAGENESGSVYLVTDTAGLAAARTTWAGGNPYDHLGSWVADAGDLDGDGVGDVAAVAEGFLSGDDEGRCYVFDGAATGLVASDEAFLTVDGAVPGDGPGMRAAAAGDADGNGRADLLVGVPRADRAAADSGTAWLFESHTE